jgi:hypothetical protein
MNKLATTFAMATLVTFAGCGQGTPGGPGSANKAPIFGQIDNTFNLTTPLLATSVKQGQQIEATIGVVRSGRFKKEVTLLFSDLPPEVTVEPAAPVVKPDSDSAKITFKTTPHTPVGDFKVKISGHPPRGADAQNIFKLSVARG